jgi:hypothetical protein
VPKKEDYSLQWGSHIESWGLTPKAQGFLKKEKIIILPLKFFIFSDLPPQFLFFFSILPPLKLGGWLHP